MKLFYYKDKEKPICYYNTNKQIEIPNTFNLKPFRGMWVSNVANIDLPILEDEQSYKEKINRMLEVAKTFNINAILFQVRTTNDAFYESKLNPYSRYLTGQEGKKPLFDVLKYVIDEAKKYNIEIHAWANPYRVSLNGIIKQEDYIKTCDPLNFAIKHNEFVILNKEGQMILNPAKEEVRQHIIDSMKEIVRNYEVAGIHFDDYFYPYQGLDESCNDLKDYEQREDKKMSLGDFRRHQVDLVIKGVHDALKKENPKIRFGVSPFGIWRNNTNDALGSNNGPGATESYENQYANSYKWVKEGYCDYIVPQLYWEFGHKIAPFADLCDWWQNLCKDSNVDLYIGHGAYRLGQEGEYENPLEITNQVTYANQYDTVKGNVFFTYKTFIDEDKNRLGMCELKKLFGGK